MSERAIAVKREGRKKTSKMSVIAGEKFRRWPDRSPPKKKNNEEEEKMLGKGFKTTLTRTGVQREFLSGQKKG